MVQVKIKIIAVLFLLLCKNIQAQDTIAPMAGASSESVVEVNALLKEAYILFFRIFLMQNKIYRFKFFEYFSQLFKPFPDNSRFLLSFIDIIRQNPVCNLTKTNPPDSY